MQQQIADNLNFLRRHYKLSQQQMAEALGINRSSLSAYENGKHAPDIALLDKYARHFNLKIDDLVRRNLQEDYQRIVDESAQPAPFRVLALTVDQTGNENIELVNEKAAAGYTYGYGDPEYVRNLPKFQLPWLKNGTFRAFQIVGDSMLPIVSGSIIVGEFVERMREVQKEQAYIFVTSNNGILFKRVSSLEKDRIVLKSDNRSYASYTLPLSEIKEVWRAKIYMSSNFS